MWNNNNNQNNYNFNNRPNNNDFINLTPPPPPAYIQNMPQYQQNYPQQQQRISNQAFLSNNGQNGNNQFYEQRRSYRPVGDNNMPTNGFNKGFRTPNKGFDERDLNSKSRGKSGNKRESLSIRKNNGVGGRSKSRKKGKNFF